jgi:hypothetical protein
VQRETLRRMTNFFEMTGDPAGNYPTSTIDVGTMGQMTCLPHSSIHKNNRSTAIYPLCELQCYCQNASCYILLCAAGVDPKEKHTSSINSDLNNLPTTTSKANATTTATNRRGRYHRSVSERKWTWWAENRKSIAVMYQFTQP